MNRLTERDVQGIVTAPNATVGMLLDRLAAYEDTGLEPKDVEDLHGRVKENIGMATLWAERYYDLLAAQQNTTTQHIADLLQAESEGRLIVRPGKVYQTDGVNIYESTVRKVIYDTGHFAFDEDAIGRSVWLTREEAEAALGGDGDG